MLQEDQSTWGSLHSLPLLTQLCRSQAILEPCKPGFCSRRGSSSSSWLFHSADIFSFLFNIPFFQQHVAGCISLTPYNHFCYKKEKLCAILVGLSPKVPPGTFLLEKASPIQLCLISSKMRWLKVDSVAIQAAQVLVFANSVTLDKLISLRLFPDL